MLVLDTNVLSELLRITPDSMVVEWVAAQPLSGLYTTAITEAEMLYGAHLLAAGPRRRQLEHALAGLFGEDFFSRILAFDSAAARFYAEIAAKRKAQGRPITQADAQIAAIVASADARLVTRNVRDFEECGIQVINPWSIGVQEA
ncbi:MAG: type II toxin-antitoxin system VapC family toxin [Gammaproteobacteria bacterium]|nr:type II toxin-antitoxin system VapC family toxin [Gammaproteobacteria bacterium]